MPSPHSQHAAPDAPVTVVGAGLTGAMMALLLAQRGVKVRVVELRYDSRVKPADAKTPDSGWKNTVIEKTGAFGQLTSSKTRSINLALSHRGITALQRVKILDRVQPSLIPMEGRAVHSVNGNVSFQPYGLGHQAIYSVSRAALNDLLLDELEKLPNVELVFGARVQRINPDGSLIVAAAGDERRTLQCKIIIGADGAFSAVRGSMFRHARINFSQEYATHGYKELTIPATPTGDWAMPAPNALHIWPRHEFMLIALPNPDKTFTCTLFAPWKDLDAITTREQAKTYFEKNFPDAIPLMPHFLEEFEDHPSSALVTVRCDPWNVSDKVILMGDAAHACVPFYGQGMNAGFEDCVVFDEIWDLMQGDAHKTVLEFNWVRQPIGNALVDLSLENYVEMRSKTAKPWWVAKRKLELGLYWLFPKRWIPQYNMVAFTRIPYHEALARAKKQDRLLGITLAGICVGAAVGLAKLAHQFWPSSWPSVGARGNVQSS